MSESILNLVWSFLKEITKSLFLNLDLVKCLKESDFAHFFEGGVQI